MTGLDLSKRCCKQVKTQGTSMHWHQCFSAGTVTRDGELFCKIHDPIAVLARHDARCAKWEAERKADRARWEQDARDQARSALCVAACEGLSDEIVKRMANFGRYALEYYIRGKVKV